jgi:hypothetical protein
MEVDLEGTQQAFVLVKEDIQYSFGILLPIFVFLIGRCRADL